MQHLHACLKNMLTCLRTQEQQREDVGGLKVKSPTVLLPIVGSASLNRVFIVVVVTILYTDTFLGNAT